MDSVGEAEEEGGSVMSKRLFTYVLFGFLLCPLGFSVSSAQAAPVGADAIEVQIPKPKFEIFRDWEYGGFWRWDEKDPRFFKEFLKNIHNSLFVGPF